MDLGYVVMEWNQASGQPSIAFEAPYMFDTQGEAHDKAEQLREPTRSVGRRERYAVATIYLEEDPK
jgi:hypothetical protein